MISVPMIPSEFAYKILEKEKKNLKGKSLIEILKINEITIQKTKR